MSIERGMNKKDMAHIYTMKYYSAIKRNDIVLFEATLEEPRDCHIE